MKELKQFIIENQKVALENNRAIEYSTLEKILSKLMEIERKTQ